MKPTLQIVARDEAESLPVLATATDVREVIRFLKHHPEGITAVQATDAFRKRIFDARKVSAYEFWKIILRNGDRLKLTPLGWELAKCLTPEARVYRTVLRNNSPYHDGLEWIQEQELELVTHVDIGEFWREHHSQVLQSESEEQLEAYAASFFHICHEAEVGSLTVGRKGQPTRLHINPEELESYLTGNAITYEETIEKPVEHKTPRVFISHGGASPLLKHIVNGLELADLQFESSDRAEWVVDKTLAVLKRCDAGVIVITESNGRVDDLLLIQLGAALVHFGKRLLLVIKRGLMLPPDFHDLARCEVEDELTWNSGLELMKAIKRLRSDSV